LESEACRKPPKNIESLKDSLVKAAASVLQDIPRVAIAKCPDRLEKGVIAKGGHFEKC